jgi:hypothetical protein
MSAIWSEVPTGNYLDEPLMHMFTEVVIADFDMLGAGAQLGKL